LAWRLTRIGRFRGAIINKYLLDFNYLLLRENLKFHTLLTSGRQLLLTLASGRLWLLTL
jgi:hypothetical protein